MNNNESSHIPGLTNSQFARTPPLQPEADLQLNYDEKAPILAAPQGALKKVGSRQARSEKASGNHPFQMSYLDTHRQRTKNIIHSLASISFVVWAIGFFGYGLGGWFFAFLGFSLIAAGLLLRRSRKARTREHPAPNDFLPC